jgi:hypothetical protein
LQRCGRITAISDAIRRRPMIRVLGIGAELRVRPTQQPDR